MFEEDGQVRRHAGVYADWLERRRTLAVVDTPTTAPANATRTERERERAMPRKLSYMLQRELDGLPAEIERLERRVAELRGTASEPSFYQRPQPEVQQVLAELQTSEENVETAIERWAELEALAANAAQREP